MHTYKLIVAGGRDFSEPPLMEIVLNDVINEIRQYCSMPIEIVSGGAKGADTLAILYAESYGYTCTVKMADWNHYGKRAGYIRNAEMAEYADGLVAFWDGKSKGTKHMINIANSKGLTVLVINY